jgi:uncharacterized protein (DUF58 family)
VLHVNQLAAERAAEIVAVIDAFTDIGPPGGSTLDRAVRGAAGIARAYTRAGDRVGVITLAEPLRWIPPGNGPVQFFRIAETVLDARSFQSYVLPDLTRIPRTVLPPSALVVLFSPLLDERAIHAATRPSGSRLPRHRHRCARHPSPAAAAVPHRRACRAHMAAGTPGVALPAGVPGHTGHPLAG